MRRLVGAVVALSMGNAAALAVHDEPSPSDPATAAELAAASSSVTTPTTVPAPPPTTVAPPTTARPAPRASAKAAPTTTSPTTTPVGDEDLWSVQNKGFDYVLTLQPTCGKPGDTFTATMRLTPVNRSSGLFMAIYADGAGFEEGKGAFPEPDGTITYTWVAKPLPGEGRLVTKGYDGKAEQGGTKVVAFRVTGPGESC
jgi:hypothetical protein